MIFMLFISLLFEPRDLMLPGGRSLDVLRGRRVVGL